METPSSLPPSVVLTASEIESIPPKPLGTLHAVSHRVLWQDGASMAGVLTVEPGHRLGEHAHRASHHHMWVLSGRATILGTEVSAGSYVHVPAGVNHDIDAASTEGCTLFYLYLRDPD